MLERPPKPTVAVVNHDQKWNALLQRMFELSELAVVTLVTERSAVDADELADFLARADPRVVVFTIATPYAENLASLRQAQSRDLNPERRYVLTAENPDAVVEQTAEIDILRLSRDISQLARIGLAVREALLLRHGVVR